MKRVVLVVILGMVMTAWTAVHAGNNNIRWTVHNMSNNTDLASGLTQGQRHFVSLGVDQVCIFCHTPHHSEPAKPLWNKVMPTQTFKMYTSSATLTNAAKAVTAPGPESLLCLSCHDGRTAINVIHTGNYGIAVGSDQKVDIGGDYDDPFGAHPTGDFSLNLPMFGGEYRANLGKTETDPYAGNNLMDDHPISFSYASAYQEKVDAGLSSLKPIETPKSQGLRFFGPNRDRMECSTCHDPHVAYGYTYDRQDTGVGDKSLTPFLTRSNEGSAMCLACHNK
ncbi:cytochrome c3 family protein [Geobacter sulfurreducens]|uniref:cytochrome c3 family protein n=1 Tax=Geobacter sulfurreducens TaxID=35554 RepID=UPI000DBB5ED5|nr:cytochrome c3 family protein [Geobacter sulfurreducens]BBA71314.1 C-type multiheme cytochrome [Geobacter sulfurreducens]